MVEEIRSSLMDFYLILCGLFGGVNTIKFLILHMYLVLYSFQSFGF